ncbi:TadE/TadG family type IV pilus assembly protein [Litorimonas sp. RW-G-Af-16]|uniref:TadE/TadG family type IV pilus assembly protein n=1 Tax=Litorimonas sp. RW-G-Af-16 TaxID=3241168 RepID=UPI00390CB67D
MKRYYLRARAIVRKFQKDNEGATAIEFAIVAIPFFMLAFGIIELAIIFFINSTLTHSVSEAGRQIRVGLFQPCGGEAEFKALVCEGMNNMAGCSDNVVINVMTAPSFKDISPPKPDPDTGVLPPASYIETTAGQPVVVQALFKYDLALPAQLTRLNSTPGSNSRILQASTAFRNEPFPDGGACGG